MADRQAQLSVPMPVALGVRALQVWLMRSPRAPGGTARGWPPRRSAAACLGLRQPLNNRGLARPHLHPHQEAGRSTGLLNGRLKQRTVVPDTQQQRCLWRRNVRLAVRRKGPQERQTMSGCRSWRSFEAARVQMPSGGRAAQPDLPAALIGSPSFTQGLRGPRGPARCRRRPSAQGGRAVEVTDLRAS
jgi:hypothetical protein